MTREAPLDLMRPVDEAVRGWPRKTGRAARNRVLDAVRAHDLSYQSWDEATWVEVSSSAGPVRLHIAALGHLLGGYPPSPHRRDPPVAQARGPGLRPPSHRARTA